MSDEQDKLKLSLEPPKLFGRKKKSDAMGPTKRTSSAPATERRPSSDVPEAPVEEPTAEIAEDDLTEELEETPAEPVAEPVAETPSDPAPAPEPGPVAEAAPQPEPDPVAEPEATPDPEPEPQPTPQKVAEPVPAAKTPADRPAPAAKAEKAAAVAAPVRKTAAAKPAVKPAAEKSAAAARSGASASTAVAKATDAPKRTRPRAKLAPDIEPEPLTRADHEDAEIVARADEPPLLSLYPAAAVTGVVVGGAMILLIWVSLRGCEAIRDTSTCSGGPGFLLLVATFVLCVLLGSTLLKVFAIPDPGSGSFLAVGLIAVAALVFLIEVLDHWSMVIVIPLIGVGAYLASVWVTKTFVEPGDI